MSASTQRLTNRKARPPRVSSGIMKRDDDPERVSLAPLKPVDALRALLKVDPDSEPSESDQKPKQGEPEEKNTRE